MPDIKKLQATKLKLQPLAILKAAAVYIKTKPLFMLSVIIFNIGYLSIFPLIKNGISNPLSIIWLIGYYIFWCVFYRYYYNLKPYFFFKAVTSSLKPSTKAVVLLFLLMLFIAFLPMVPLFLGYDNLYLDFYEKYMQTIENLSAKNMSASDWHVMMAVYGIFILLAPILICKPYLAWIASLCRRNLSFSEVAQKIRGNYWRLVFISFILVMPDILITPAEIFFHLPNYFGLALNSLIFAYTNVVFAKIYDFFYIAPTEQKTSI